MSDMMRLKHPYQRGSAIVRLHEDLDMIGCYHGKPDGIFGPLTDKAVRAFQRTHHLDIDGKVGSKTKAAIDKNMDAIMSPGKPRVEISDPCLFDFRSGHAKPKRYSRTRNWKDITGILWHQTGCTMGNTPERWKRVNAQIGISKRNECILINEPTDMIWHGHGLSPTTMGIEVEGNFAGISGNPKTLWKPGGPEAHLTPGMIEAAGLAVEWVVRQLELNGQKLLHMFGHRQSSNKRTADPGSEIWQEIALPWIEKLGLSDGGPGYTRGTGRPIPREWDSKSDWRYWG